jgi:hypothetical protein
MILGKRGKDSAGLCLTIENPLDFPPRTSALRLSQQLLIVKALDHPHDLDRLNLSVCLHSNEKEILHQIKHLGQLHVCGVYSMWSYGHLKNEIQTESLFPAQLHNLRIGERFVLLEIGKPPSGHA